jgi:hypothetical protein
VSDLLVRDAEALHRALAGSGSEVRVALSRETAELVARLVDARVRGEEILVTAGNAEVTPTEAAVLLGMSRPQVRNLLALAIEGPALGRPLVDTIKGSVLPNLKELRPGSAGASEVRLLFVFDPQRQAVILVGGDKAGNWRGWYRTAVPLAEAVYAEHLNRIAKEGGE